MSERTRNMKKGNRRGGNVPTTANDGPLRGLLQRGQETQTGTAGTTIPATGATVTEPLQNNATLEPRPRPETSLARAPVNQPVSINTSSGIGNPAGPVPNQFQQMEGNNSEAIPDQFVLTPAINHPKLADVGKAPVPGLSLNAVEDVANLPKITGFRSSFQLQQSIDITNNLAGVIKDLDEKSHKELIMETEIIPNLTMKKKSLINSIKEERKMNANLELEIQKLSETVGVLSTQLDKKKSDEHLLKGEISGREIILENTRTELPNLKKELARIKDKCEKVNEKREKLELTIQIRDDTIKRLQTHHASLTMVRRAWRNKVEARTARVAGLTSENNEARQRMLALKKRNVDWDREISRLEGELEKQDKEWDEEEKGYEEEIDQWQKKVKDLRASLGMEMDNEMSVDQGGDGDGLDEGGNMEEPDVESISLEDSSGNEESNVTAEGARMVDGEPGQRKRDNFAADVETD